MEGRVLAAAAAEEEATAAVADTEAAALFKVERTAVKVCSPAVLRRGRLLRGGARGAV